MHKSKYSHFSTNQIQTTISALVTTINVLDDGNGVN